MADTTSLTVAQSAVSARDDAWLTPRRFGLILGLFILAAFPQIIFGLQTFVYRDFGYFTYPVAHFQRECFWRGELPFWNPYNGCGIPFLAQWNTTTLYPPALFYLLFPLSWSLGVFQLLHLALGGAGMFFLARRWTGNNFAAAFAGIVFAFNGLSENCLMWVSNLAALMWMPWVVLATERAVRDGGTRFIIAAIVGALQMLTGSPEIILMTWIFSGLVALGLSWKRLFRFMLLAVLVAAFSAAQLLPFVELLAHSHRGEQFSTGSWAMPVSGLGNFLVPLFHSHASYHGVHLQVGQGWTSSYYIGTATLGLAALAIWRARGRKIWALAAFAVMGLIFALGDAGGVYGWLRHHVPGLGWMRYPIKFVVIPIFAVPLLASFALAKMQDDAIEPRTIVRRFGIVWASLAALMMTLFWVAAKFPALDERWTETLGNGLTRLGFLTAIFFIFALCQRNLSSKSRRLFQLILLLLVWLDLFTHAPRQQTVNRETYSELVAPRVQTTPKTGLGRAMVNPATLAKLDSSHIPNPAKDYTSRRWMLVYNCNLIEDIPKVDGFFSLHVREQKEAALELLGDTNGYPASLADFVGVTTISVAASMFDWTTRSTALPLVTGGQKPVFANAQITLENIAGRNFNPLREVFLPVDAKSSVSATNQSSVKLSNEKFATQQIEFEAEAESPAMIVVAQTFYHAWRSYVDGRPAKLWRANHAFQALEIPAGRHTVKLVYEDRMFFIGGLISLISLAGCVVTSWILNRKKPKTAF